MRLGRVLSLLLGASVAIVVVLMLPGCESEPMTDDVPLDAPADAGGRACTTASDCDDGLFCNGEEVCAAGFCAAGTDPCDDGVACTLDVCDEARLRCTSTPADEDGDGAFDASCLDDEGIAIGDDCDDTDADRFPGNLEICDGSHDEDCDPDTLGDVDDDGDGFQSGACCNGAECGEDCDDARAGSFPGATEVCDGLDQNCDGTADEGLTLEGFVDGDSDGYGAGAPLSACPGTPRFSDVGGDCDDTRRDISPGMPEICDEIRNDCTAAEPDVGAGAVNWYGDTDGDGFGSAASGVTLSCTPVPDTSLNQTDCDDSNPMVNPGAAELCNGIDDDCHDGPNFRIGPNNLEDDDLDGLVDVACTPVGTDCNDNDPATGPGELERCDSRDNDCDGTIDEGAASSVYYRDADGDGFGSEASGAMVACMAGSGYVSRGGDCNDADVARYPTALETCNAADDDCDAATDEAPASSVCMPAGASASTCVAGRCVVDSCTAGFDDCNRNAMDGCEVNLASSFDHCSACGASCAGLGPCVAGICSRAYVVGGVSEGNVDQPRATAFTIDLPTTGNITYTFDGSAPGSSRSMVGAAPVTFTLSTSTRVRYRADHPGGYSELGEFSFNLDTRTNAPAAGGYPYSLAPADHSRGIVENLTINGQGPVATVAPGASVTVTYNVQGWHESPTGPCVGCVIYMELTRALPGGGTSIVDCLGNVSTYYPGINFGSRAPAAFTAPSIPGVYPFFMGVSPDFSCTPIRGAEVGYLVVAP
jgi:hypothetical protein